MRTILLLNLLQSRGDALQGFIPRDSTPTLPFLLQRVFQTIGRIYVIGQTGPSGAYHSPAERVFLHPLHFDQLAVFDVSLYAAHLKAQHANRFTDLGFN
jgi:hypothetical protein